MANIVILSHTFLLDRSVDIFLINVKNLKDRYPYTNAVYTN